jgi:flagellar motor protein MotB
VVSAQRQNNADVVVIGHASGRTQQLDKVEHELANFRISLARANRVASQLIAMGVDPQKVQVEAFADDSQLFSETMPSGEAGNRRAEIYFRQ